MELVEVGSSAFDLEPWESCKKLRRRWSGIIVPYPAQSPSWSPGFLYSRISPRNSRSLQFIEAITSLKANLPSNPALGQIHAHIEAALPDISVLRSLLIGKSLPSERVEESASSPGNKKEQSALDWLDELVQATTKAEANSSSLVTRYAQIMARAEQYVSEMDFRFLYHMQRRVFHIGFNLDAGQLDHNYYDLLASEARIASIIAIAKGEVPQSHWLHLGRPVTRCGWLHMSCSRGAGRCSST